MAAYDPKQFFELLLEYKSDETKKARRNVSAVAFVIFGAKLLGLKLSDIRVFNVDLTKSADLWLLVLAAVLLIYWCGMFILSWLHDREIQRERKLLLTSAIDEATRQYEQTVQELQKNPTGVHPDVLPPLKAFMDAHRRQQERTRRASRYGSFIKKLELIIPLFIFVVALLVLTADIYELYSGLGHH